MIAALLHLLTTPRPRWRAVALAGVTDDELLTLAHAAHVVRHSAGTVLVTSRHRRGQGRRVPGDLRLPRPDRTTRRRIVLALRYVGLIGGVVACAVILSAPPVLATAAGLVGALLGTAVAR